VKGQPHKEENVVERNGSTSTKGRRNGNGQRAPEDVDTVQDDDIDDDDIADPDADAYGEAERKLREYLASTVKVDHLDEPVRLVNKRPLLGSRFSPFDLGIQDGLARYPDATPEIVPNAVVMLRDDEWERAKAIEKVQLDAECDLEILVQGLETKHERAKLRLHEAIYRLLTRHPRRARAGYFDSVDGAALAVADARARAEAEAEKEAREREAEESDGEDDEPPVDQRPGEEPIDNTVVDPVRPTLDQRIAASKELVWSIPQKWFWAGSFVLFAAEFPFLMVVVRQLLLDRDPWMPLVVFSTFSIMVGFLIGTKLTGLLLRRAQSMLLLASLIHPERRPTPMRFLRWFAGKTTGQGDPTPTNDPTEAGLRFGAWTRLVAAGLLAGLLVWAVFSIAIYRSEAAAAVALQDSVAEDLGGQDFDLGDEPTAAEATADDETSDDDRLPIVSPETLQDVFLAIALLNLVGAIALAWASTTMPYEVVPSDDEDDEDDEDDDAEPDPIDGAGAEGAGGPREQGRHRRRRRRRAVDLEREVEVRREDVDAISQRLAAAKVRLQNLDRQSEVLDRLSAAQGQLDEHAYWWANRMSRKFVVQPKEDRALATARGKTPSREERRGGSD
jgi:hypothetical protein